MCVSRRLLHKANETLRKVLLEVVRNTIATEDLIGQKISVGAKKSEQSTKGSPGNIEKQESGECTDAKIFTIKSVLALLIRIEMIK